MERRRTFNFLEICKPCVVSVFVRECVCVSVVFDYTLGFQRQLVQKSGTVWKEIFNNCAVRIQSTLAHSDIYAQLRIHTQLTVRKFSWKNNFPYYYKVFLGVCTNSYQLIIIVLFWIETWRRFSCRRNFFA